ncbi:hypothetical protein [Dyella sp.]|nr:hypothetical protein [Dyella sp.]HET7330383.1 hypothetical protein [Dyella sp.]
MAVALTQMKVTKATPDFGGATNAAGSRTLMILHIDIQKLP